MNKAHRVTVLTNAEAEVWNKLLRVSWSQMQSLFPRLFEYGGPRQRYFVRDVTSRRKPNARKTPAPIETSLTTIVDN